MNNLHADVRRTAVTKIAHARFLAIAIMLRGFEKEVEDELLSYWEKVTFRIFGLGGADTRMKVGDYVRLAYDLYKNEMPADQIKNNLIKIGSDKDYDITLLISEDDYWDNCYEGWTDELRYLLFRYDEHLAAQAGEQINTLQWKKIWMTDPSKSIEHIVPQSANTSFKHHLGNLVMLTPGMNSSLQDDPPKDKANSYCSSGLRETMKVGAIIQKSGEWTEEDVKKRAQRIGEFIKERLKNLAC